MSSENKNPPEVTKITLSPEAVILRYQDGFYSVDGDKEFDSPNVMSLMGRYLERYLTVDLATFEKHKAGKSLKAKDIDQPEAYHYSTIGDFVMRSQLDAHDPRLPAPGIFDLKTRSCLPIRMASSDFEWGMDYELTEQTGDFSYEREYVDMARATMLKYMLQARIGRMDGIFVAYHNLARIFGFQYLSINDMDLTLHGQYDRTLGDQEFLASMHFLDQLVNQAVAKFPGQVSATLDWPMQGGISFANSTNSLCEYMWKHDHQRGKHASSSSRSLSQPKKSKHCKNLIRM